MNNEYTMLTIAKVLFNEDYVRFQALADKETYANQLAELAKSISENGLINPITVIEKNGSFVVVAGNRRLSAARQLGWKEIPAHIMEGNEFALAMTSNISQMDMTPIEKGKWVAEAVSYYKNQEPYKASKQPVEDILTYLGKLLGKEPRTLREWMNKAKGDSPSSSSSGSDKDKKKSGRKKGQKTSAEEIKNARKGFETTAGKMAEYAAIIAKHPEEFKKEKTFLKVLDKLTTALAGLQTKLSA